MGSTRPMLRVNVLIMAILIPPNVQAGLHAVLLMGTVATEQLGVRLEARGPSWWSILEEDVLASAVLTMIVPTGRPAAPAMDTVAINGSGVPEKNEKEEQTEQLATMIYIILYT